MVDVHVYAKLHTSTIAISQHNKIQFALHNPTYDSVGFYVHTKDHMIMNGF